MREELDRSNGIWRFLRRCFGMGAGRPANTVPDTIDEEPPRVTRRPGEGVGGPRIAPPPTQTVPTGPIHLPGSRPPPPAAEEELRGTIMLDTFVQLNDSADSAGVPRWGQDAANSNSPPSQPGANTPVFSGTLTDLEQFFSDNPDDPLNPCSGDNEDDQRGGRAKR